MFLPVEDAGTQAAACYSFNPSRCIGIGVSGRGSYIDSYVIAVMLRGRPLSTEGALMLPNSHKLEQVLMIAWLLQTAVSGFRYLGG